MHRRTIPNSETLPGLLIWVSTCVRCYALRQTSCQLLKLHLVLDVTPTLSVIGNDSPVLESKKISQKQTAAAALADCSQSTPVTNTKMEAVDEHLIDQHTVEKIRR